MPSDRTSLARDCYLAFAAGDRARMEELLGDELTFSSPYDVGLDRAGYFERCWPGSGRGNRFEFERVVEIGDEVLVTYESEKDDGTRFRNTEILGFAGDRIRSVEVYFGWDL
jgi:ketosteroid isomerase-like protein